MNAAVFRPTAFELVSLQQGPNQFRVVAVSRTMPPTVNHQGGLVPPPAITLDVGEELFSDEEMAQVHATLELLENKFTAKFNEWATDPTRIADAVNAAAVAEMRRDAAEAMARELKARQAEKLAELAALDEQIAAKKAVP